jgi:hypothetical protein
VHRAARPLPAAAAMRGATAPRARFARGGTCTPPLRRPLLLLALCAAAAASAALPGPAAAADGAAYDPWEYNKVCRYSATNIPANLFQNGIDAGREFLFPLEDKRAIDRYERPWEACFGPKEAYNMAAIEAGWKLPCKYQVRAPPGGDGRERPSGRAVWAARGAWAKGPPTPLAGRWPGP